MTRNQAEDHSTFGRKSGSLMNFPPSSTTWGFYFLDPPKNGDRVLNPKPETLKPERPLPQSSAYSSPGEQPGQGALRTNRCQCHEGLFRV